MTSAVVSNKLMGHKREEGGNITRLSCVSVWSVDSRMPDCAARPGPGDWCGGPGCAARRSAAEITGSAARRPVTSSHQHGAALDTVTSPVIQQREETRSTLADQA